MSNTEKRFIEDCIRGDINAVKQSIKQEIDIHYKDDEALIKTILSYSNNRYKIIKYLLDNGSNPAARNHFPIEFFSEFNEIKSLRLLLKYGEDVNEKDGFPLTIATEKSHYGIAKELLINGADPNLTDDIMNDCGDAIDNAVMKNDKKMVNLLMSFGAVLSPRLLQVALKNGLI